MKTILTTIVLVVSCVLLSCNTQPSPLDVDMTILFDMTDKVTTFPSADDFVSQLNLKDQPLQSIRITVGTISDKDVNAKTVITLDKESEWQSNSTIRKAKIHHFTNQLQLCLNAIQQTDTSGHSIIYRSIVAQANRLATSTAKKKMLIIYSNLYENSEVNFYHPGTIALLRTNPKRIEQQLAQQGDIASLKAMGIWLIYNPASYRDNNHFRPIASWYQNILQEHGAAVYVDTKFILQ